MCESVLAEADERERAGTGDAFGNPNYDISPDGRRFLMVQGRSAEKGLVSIVINWPTESERIVAEGS